MILSSFCRQVFIRFSQPLEGLRNISRHPSFHLTSCVSIFINLSLSEHLHQMLWLVSSVCNWGQLLWHGQVNAAADFSFTTGKSCSAKQDLWTNSTHIIAVMLPLNKIFSSINFPQNTKVPFDYTILTQKIKKGIFISQMYFHAGLCCSSTLTVPPCANEPHYIHLAEAFVQSVTGLLYNMKNKARGVSLKCTGA